MHRRIWVSWANDGIRRGKSDLILEGVLRVERLLHDINANMNIVSGHTVSFVLNHRPLQVHVLKEM